MHIHKLKTFLQQSCGVNAFCRTVDFMAVIYYALIAVLFVSNLVPFLPTNPVSHHISYLFLIQVTDIQVGIPPMYCRAL